MSRSEALFRKLLLFLAWGQVTSLRFPLTVVDVGMRLDLRSELEMRWHGPIRVIHALPQSIDDMDVQFLTRFRDVILSGYPSSLTLLAERLERVRKSLSLRLIATRGELLHERTRRYLENVFAREVVDFYNCEEIGNIAWECAADTNRFHINTDACVVEVVDQSGQPLPTGQEGRILVTNLYNCTMPFIRYDLQDRGELLPSSLEPCDCGSYHPAIGKIQGRDDDFLIRSDGTRMSPRLVATTLEQVADQVPSPRGEDAPFRSYQICQDSPNHITIRIIPQRTARAPLETSVINAFRLLDPGWRCTVEWVECLPYASSGKSRKVVRGFDLPSRRLQGSASAQGPRSTSGHVAQG